MCPVEGACALIEELMDSDEKWSGWTMNTSCLPSNNPSNLASASASVVDAEEDANDEDDLEILKKTRGRADACQSAEGKKGGCEGTG